MGEFGCGGGRTGIKDGMSDDDDDETRQNDQNKIAMKVGVDCTKLQRCNARRLPVWWSIEIRNTFVTH